MNRSLAGIAIIAMIAMIAVCLAGRAAPAQGTDPADSFLPKEVAADDFESLREQSPFTRTLSLSDSLILTGIALVDGERVATLLNRETKKTYVVSSEANSQGWKMVDLKVNDDLEKVAAKVSVDGGEVVTVRYGEWQLEPGEARPGAGPGGDDADGRDRGRRGRGGGPRRGPPPEVRQKIRQLEPEQRRRLFQRMREIRRENPDLSRDEMRVERLSRQN